MVLTNFGNDTADDKLFLSGGLDCSAEILVVPCVDLTLTADQGGIGIHFGDLLEQEAVGALVGRASHNDRQVENLG